MNYNFLGRTGIKVSSLCFGTMSFGGASDMTTSRKVYNKCRDAGINFFDCANVYMGGESEKILGKLMKGHRDEVVITSKVYFKTGIDVNAGGSSRYHIMRAVEQSLERLDTDRIDLYFLHRFDDTTPIEETLRALDDLVCQGKVVYLGASNFAAWQVAKALGISHAQAWNRFECIQPMYNLVKRQAEVELLPMAQSEQLGVISYSPLGGGLLTGKYGAKKRPKAGRLMENKMYQIRYADQAMYDVAEKFTLIAKDIGVHPVSLAIAWVNANPAITAPIIGARNLKQLQPALDSTGLNIDQQLYDMLCGLTPTPGFATDRNEETTEHNYGVRK